MEIFILLISSGYSVVVAIVGCLRSVVSSERVCGLPCFWQSTAARVSFLQCKSVCCFPLSQTPQSPKILPLTKVLLLCMVYKIFQHISWVLSHSLSHLLLLLQQHASVEESHWEDMTFGWTISWIWATRGFFPCPWNVHFPTLPIWGTVSRMYPWESRVLLRTLGLCMWLQPFKASTSI